MNLETALKKPRTISELVELTGLTRVSVANFLKKYAKKAGKQISGKRGPAPWTYVESPSKTAKVTKRKYARRAKVIDEALAVPASYDANGSPLDAPSQVEYFPAETEAPPAVPVIETAPAQVEAVSYNTNTDGNDI